MRYSAALVLGTVVLSEAATLRHAGFHARRHAEASKRDIKDVDWSAVSYDLSGVDWSKVNFNNNNNNNNNNNDNDKNKPAPAPVSSTAPAPVPTPSAPAPPKDVPSDDKPKTDKPKTIGGAVTNFLNGVDSAIKRLGVSSVGVNDVSNNGGLWIGEDSKWKSVFTNDANRDLVLFCWESKGFSGMSINVNKPAISVGLQPGEKVTVSFTEGVPSACAHAFDDTTLAIFGGLFQTWTEYTFGPQGAFDVSRNVNMKGNAVSMKGSKCTSDMNTCVFHCQDQNAASCETGYALAGMDAPGCGGGYDPVMQGVGGGCSMGHDGETVQVTFT